MTEEYLKQNTDRPLHGDAEGGQSIPLEIPFSPEPEREEPVSEPADAPECPKPEEALEEQGDELTINIEGQTVDMLTLPSVKIADVMIDRMGNLKIVKEGAEPPNTDDFQDEPELCEAGESRGALDPLSADIFSGKRDTGIGEDVLSPLEENLYDLGGFTGSDREQGQDGRGNGPVFVPITRTKVYNNTPIYNVAPDIIYRGEPEDAYYRPEDGIVPNMTEGTYYRPEDGIAPNMTEGAYYRAEDGIAPNMTEGTYYRPEDGIAPNMTEGAYYRPEDGIAPNMTEGAYYQSGDPYHLGNTHEGDINLYYTPDGERVGPRGSDRNAREEEMYHLLRTEKESGADRKRKKKGKGARGRSYDGAYSHRPGTDEYSEPSQNYRGAYPEGDYPTSLKAETEYYVGQNKINRKALTEGLRRCRLVEEARATYELLRAKSELLEAELSFGKRDATSLEKRELKKKRRELKERQKDLTRVGKTAKKKGERYYKPLLRATEMVTSSLNPAATSALISRLAELLRQRDSINARLIQLYGGSGRHLRAKYRCRERAMRREYKKQIRRAKAIRKYSVPRDGRARLYELMDRCVSLRGDIKAMAYTLNKERVHGPRAAALRSERRLKVKELERVRGELHRTEMDTVRRSKDRKGVRSSMLIGWSCVILLALAGVMIYLFREPLWELVRGWINALFDFLGWTHFGRL